MRPMIALLLVLCGGCTLVRHSQLSRPVRSMKQTESIEIPYVKGSNPCCPVERHPAAGCLLGDCDRERYSPRLISSNECSNDLEHWVNPRDNCQEICLWERLVGRRRARYGNPLLLLADCCRDGSPAQYSRARSERDDNRTITSAIVYFSISIHAR